MESPSDGIAGGAVQAAASFRFGAVSNCLRNARGGPGAPSDTGGERNESIVMGMVCASSLL